MRKASANLLKILDIQFAEAISIWSVSGFKLAKFAQWILRMNDLRMQECRNKTSKKQQSVRD